MLILYFAVGARLNGGILSARGLVRRDKGEEYTRRGRPQRYQPRQGGQLKAAKFTRNGGAK